MQSFVLLKYCKHLQIKGSILCHYKYDLWVRFIFVVGNIPIFFKHLILFTTWFHFYVAEFWDEKLDKIAATGKIKGIRIRGWESKKMLGELAQ